MARQTPSELAAKQQLMIEEFAAGERDVQQKIRRLVSCDGYPYAKSRARVLLKEYECRPPTTDAERTKWEIYTAMKWAVDHIFNSLEQIAAEPEPQRPLVKVGTNADNGSTTKPKFNTRPDAAAVARRRTTRS